MRNAQRWTATKYVYREGRLAASRDPQFVSVGSRLMVDLVASFYDRNLKLHAGGRLLDLGCGSVPLYQAYTRLVSENTCVDWANTLHNNDYLDFEVDLTQELPFAESSFDTIICSDVLEHIPVPDRLFREMARVLASQGKLLLNVPFYYGIHEEPYDFFRYTEFGLRRLVESSGLRIVELEPIGGAPEIVADIAAKNALRLGWGGVGLARFVQWCARLALTAKVGKKISRSTQREFPFGYFLVAEKPASGQPDPSHRPD